MPEPEPLGVSVEPLGDDPAPIVLPDGLVVELDPLAEPAVLPVVLPLPLMVLPLVPVPAAPLPAPPLAALAPPAPPAPPPPPAWANANVELRASTEAKAMVLNFMMVSSACMS